VNEELDELSRLIKGAQFAAGDSCVHASGQQIESPGRTVSTGYHRGRAFIEDGVRFAYRFGYTVRELGVKDCFYPAGKLYTPLTANCTTCSWSTRRS
jgi:hypothetical protein